MRHGKFQGAPYSVLIPTCTSHTRKKITLRVRISKLLEPRVYNKEEKRVSSVLYGPCKTFSESHVPGIQTLTNENAQFK